MFENLCGMIHLNDVGVDNTVIVQNPKKIKSFCCGMLNNPFCLIFKGYLFKFPFKCFLFLIKIEMIDMALSSHENALETISNKNMRK